MENLLSGCIFRPFAPFLEEEADWTDMRPGSTRRGLRYQITAEERPRSPPMVLNRNVAE